MSALKKTFLIKEARVVDVHTFKRLAVSALANAFTEIEKAQQAGQRDVAASTANFAGEKLDGIMRQLSQSLLGGNS